MAQAYWTKYTLLFKRPSGTSRGVLQQKDSWFLIWEKEGFEYPALGECSIIKGLNPEPPEKLEAKLTEVCRWLNKNQLKRPDLSGFPSVRFGLETLLLDCEARGSKRLFPGRLTFGTEGMQINGLIWMGSVASMKKQVREKVAAGFRCIKLKIGAIDFGQELELLRWIREEFPARELELRVDANGAFRKDEALEKLKRLSEFDLHSIEQPIAPRQWSDLAWLCEHTPLPIALDEELIGIEGISRKEILLDTVRPQYIILKPSLAGGLHSCDEWIRASEQRSIDWWITSALESNVGLNAIAQYAFSKQVSLPQGLGTGALFRNNLESPLYIQGEFIRFDPLRSWDITPLIQ